MWRLIHAALCALALALAGCAAPSADGGPDPALQQTLLHARQRLADSAEPRIVYVGLALHSQSKAFASDTRAGADFARRLDSQAVVIELVNPALFQGGELPRATRANVEHTLAQVATMARPQDKLVLLFSTHGTPGSLALNSANREDKPLTAQELQTWLAPMQGRPTVLLLSACFSGSLIEPLRHPSRIIYTAAARNRASFGCNFHSEGTFFIDGLLRQPMTPSLSLTQLMSQAQASIAQREAGLEIKLPSLPQSFVGADMRELSRLPLGELREARFAGAARAP